MCCSLFASVVCYLARIALRSVDEGGFEEGMFFFVSEVDSGTVSPRSNSSASSSEPKKLEFLGQVIFQHIPPPLLTSPHLLLKDILLACLGVDLS